MVTNSATSHTFQDGTTIPIGVYPKAHPHPLRLISYKHSHDRIIASVPPGKQHIVGDVARWLEYVMELDCIHQQPAIVRKHMTEGTLYPYCPECRARGFISLADVDLGDPSSERAARDAWRQRQTGDGSNQWAINSCLRCSRTGRHT